MIFLIEYHRRLGQIVTFETFVDAEREKAHDAFFEIELKHYRQGTEKEIEVAILQAASEDLIRRTHRRYFETLEQILDAFDDELLSRMS